MSRLRLSKKTASNCHVPSIRIRLAALFFHPVQDKQHLFLDKTPKTAPKQPPLSQKLYKYVGTQLKIEKIIAKSFGE
jgi:hypothetical protein